MTTRPDPMYAGHRFPAAVISYAVYLDFRFPSSLRMVEEMLALRGITASHGTVRQWGLKFGRAIANRIPAGGRAPVAGSKRQLVCCSVMVEGKSPRAAAAPIPDAGT